MNIMFTLLLVIDFSVFIVSLIKAYYFIELAKHNLLFYCSIPCLHSTDPALALKYDHIAIFLILVAIIALFAFLPLLFKALKID